MRRQAFSLVALGALVSAGAPAQTTPAATPPAKAAPEGMKISGTMRCGKLEQTAMEVGDAPGHVLTIGKSACTWSEPLKMGGSRTTKGDSKVLSDVRGDVSVDHGYHVGTMANGDEYHVRFDGQTKTNKGAVESQQGRWGFVGGTGKLEGLQGRGTYKSTGTADGGTTVEVEGEYRLP